MQDEGAPWLLVVVEGPSEFHDVRDGTDAGGVVRAIVRQVFGELAARHLEFIPWKRLKRSPLREGTQRIRDHVEKARHVARLGHETTAYGTLLLLDNDHGGRDWYAEFDAAISADDTQVRQRTAIGVAVEMIEAWLLSDPVLCPPEDLPKRPADRLWGARELADANHPKQVLNRLVLKRRRWQYLDAINAWDPVRARLHSPSLNAFMGEVEALARPHGVH